MAPYEAGEQDPIIVFDMGGDQNLFWSTYFAAQELGRTFRYLTLDHELHSFTFPPFQAIPPKKRNVIHISQLLVAAFHLDHGLIYGGNYFTHANLAALLHVARQLFKDNRNATLEDVSHYLDNPRVRKSFKDAEQIRMAFSFLMEYPQLQSSRDPEMEINLDRSLQNCEVIYFFCPTLQEPLTAPIVAGLGLYTLLNTCIRRKRSGQPRRLVRVIIDEFQDLLSLSLSRFLAQCRKFDIPTVILANQSTSQLTSRDLSLADQVFEGCAIRQYFTSLGDDLTVLQSLSDTVMDVTTGLSQGGMLTASVQRTEKEMPSLHPNTIREVTGRFGFSFVCLNDGTGHRNPIIVSQVHSGADHGHLPMPRRTCEPTEDSEPSSDGKMWQSALALLWEEIVREGRGAPKEP